MDFFEALFKKINQNTWICFLSGLISGAVTHMYMLTHTLPNWDDVGNFDSYGVGGEFGRWLLSSLHPISGTYANPWLNGMLAIFLFSIAWCFVYAALELETKTSAILLPVIMMTFPSLASFMTYMFTVDLYAFGFMFVCMGAYLAKKYRFGIVIACALQILAMGLYQSCVCFTISLYLSMLIIDLIKQQADVKHSIIKGLQYAVSIIVGTVMYIGIAYYRCPEMVETSQNGIGSMGAISITRLPRLIAKAYLRITRYFILGDFSFISPLMRKTNLLILVLIIIGFVSIVRVQKLYKNKLSFAVVICLALLLPLGLSFVDIMCPDASFTMLMLYQYALLYVISLVIYEICGKLYEEKENKRIGKVENDIAKNKSEERVEAFNRFVTRYMGAVLVIALVVISYNGYVKSEEAYQRMEITFDRDYAFMNRILSRVEAMPGYNRNNPVLLMGSVDSSPMWAAFPMEEDRYEDYSGVCLEYGLLMQGARENFASIFFGKQLLESEDEAIRKMVENTDDYKQMGYFPDESSVKKIGDFYVVRLGK